MIIESIIGILGTIFDRVIPDKNLAQKQEFLQAVQEELNRTNLAQSQIEVNKEEAAAPNRRWISWRELTGYICAVAVGWQYVIYPFLDWFTKLCGLTTIPPVQLDMAQLMFLLCGMLGLSVSKTVEKAKGLRNK